MSEINVGDLNVSSELRLSIYNNASRPVNPATGFMIFNSDEEKLQVWDGSNWKSFGRKNYDISATGNYQSIDLTNEYSGYRCYKFTGDGTITVNQSDPDSGVEFVLIAGGGGGGGVIGGGGGGGDRTCASAQQLRFRADAAHSASFSQIVRRSDRSCAAGTTRKTTWAPRRPPSGSRRNGQLELLSARPRAT